MTSSDKKTNAEIKRDRFIKLAEQRTNKVIDMLRLLGNCANKSNYEYSEDDVRKILAAIDAEVKVLKSKFNEANPNNDRKFTLK